MQISLLRLVQTPIHVPMRRPSYLDQLFVDHSVAMLDSGLYILLDVSSYLVIQLLGNAGKYNTFLGGLAIHKRQGDGYGVQYLVRTHELSLHGGEYIDVENNLGQPQNTRLTVVNQAHRVALGDDASQNSTYSKGEDLAPAKRIKPSQSGRYL